MHGSNVQASVIADASRNSCQHVAGFAPRDGFLVSIHRGIAASLDLADAHARALDHLAAGGESVRCNLGTGVGVSVKQIIAAVEEVSGKTVPVKYGPRRAGDPDSLVADPSLARQLLGWEAARKDVRDMVRPAWLWVNGPNRGRFPANSRSM